MYKAVSLDPYINLATEKYLQDSLPDDAAVLYLWRNRDTAVIGVNQNPWYECRCELLERDGGYVARRLTGGGAVFHDEGNLNFSFIFNKADYSLEKNLKVIALACESAGIDASVSGRNDITANGRKFSGNAFLTRGGKTLHHGTLLIRSDVEKLTKYLCPPKEKLAAKGVKSVRSRVINLTEINAALTADKMSEYMLDAFERVMGQKAERIPEIPRKDLQADIDMFSDRQFIYGRTFPFTAELERQVKGGRVRILLDVKGGIVAFAKVYTDSLDTLLSEKIEAALLGSDYNEIENNLKKCTD